MRYKELGKTGVKVSSIGQGTMGIGGFFKEDTTKDKFYIDVLKAGIEAGMTFIDTAEAYGGGHAEVLIGKAIKGSREKVFVATKVSPENLEYNSVIKAADGSLERLQTDYIDLYQIHWPNPAISIKETLDAMNTLMRSGKVRHVGVSNFSFPELAELGRSGFLTNRIASIQIEYNLFDRTAENDILAYCEKEGISVIAYSPFDKGKSLSGLSHEDYLEGIAKKYNKTPAQVILRWLVSRRPVIAIPKSSNLAHIKENAEASDFALSEEDIAGIGERFRQDCIDIPAGQIKADKEDLSNFTPSPEVLAASVKAGIPLKPIRVRKREEALGRYEYELLEGKVRYWAWVAAYGKEALVKALVR